MTNPRTSATGSALEHNEQGRQLSNAGLRKLTIFTCCVEAGSRKQAWGKSIAAAAGTSVRGFTVGMHKHERSLYMDFTKLEFSRVLGASDIPIDNGSNMAEEQASCGVRTAAAASAAPH